MRLVADEKVRFVRGSKGKAGICASTAKPLDWETARVHYSAIGDKLSGGTGNEPCQTGLRRRRESAVNNHRETKAPRLFSTLLKMAR